MKSLSRKKNNKRKVRETIVETVENKRKDLVSQQKNE
jgi:hypothetical protein